MFFIVFIKTTQHWQPLNYQIRYAIVKSNMVNPKKILLEFDYKFCALYKERKIFATCLNGYIFSKQFAQLNEKAISKSSITVKFHQKNAIPCCSMSLKIISFHLP